MDNATTDLQIKDVRELEGLLRHCGFSGRKAKAGAAAAWRAITNDTDEAATETDELSAVMRSFAQFR